MNTSVLHCMCVLNIRDSLGYTLVIVWRPSSLVKIYIYQFANIKILANWCPFNSILFDFSSLITLHYIFHTNWDWNAFVTSWFINFSNCNLMFDTAQSITTVVWMYWNMATNSTVLPCSFFHISSLSAASIHHLPVPSHSIQSMFSPVISCLHYLLLSSILFPYFLVPLFWF